MKWLNDIRIQTKTTIGNLCFELIDERTYSRYLSGEHEIHLSLIFDFAERLNIPIDECLQTLKSIYLKLNSLA